MGLGLSFLGSIGLLCVLAPAVAQVLAPGIPTQNSSIDPFTFTLFQFAANGTFLENLAVRPNDHILTTRLDAPELWEINPSANGFLKGSAKLVHSFPDATGLLGLTRVPGGASGSAETYAVIAGTSHPENNTSVSGSCSVWVVNLNNSTADVSKITDLPQAGWINGLDALNSTHVLGVDSPMGCIWSIDIASGEVEKVICDDSMKPLSTGIPIGINGLKVSADPADGKTKVFYTNTATQKLLKHAIDPTDVTASTGEPELIFSDIFGDDLTVNNGNGWVAGGPTNVVTQLSVDSPQAKLVLGSSSSEKLAGITAVEWSTKKYPYLYGVTNGRMSTGSTSPVEPAKVVAIALVKP